MFTRLCALRQYSQNRRIEDLETTINTETSYAEKSFSDKIEFIKEKYKQSDIYAQVIQGSILIVLLLTIFLMNSKDIINIENHTHLNTETLYWAYPLNFTLLFYLIYHILLVKDTKRYPLKRFSIFIPIYFIMVYSITFSKEINITWGDFSLFVVNIILLLIFSKYIKEDNMCTKLMDMIISIFFILVFYSFYLWIIHMLKLDIISINAIISSHITITNILILLWSFIFIIIATVHNIYIKMMNESLRILEEIPLGCVPLYNEF